MGRWQVEPEGELGFKTRFLLYRPSDPRRFNGTVVVCWNNVTAGYELFQGESPETKGGVRLPQIDAPVATNSSVPVGNDFVSSLRGQNRPFGAAKLDTLYGGESQYLAHFEAAAQRALEAGALLPRDVGPAIEEAAQEYRRSHASAHGAPVVG